MNAGPVPAEHDCKECGCYSAEWGYHVSASGLCLACGGCGDPACCQHDEDCQFETQVSTMEVEQ